jgi:hypothetical protein
VKRVSERARTKNFSERIRNHFRMQIRMVFQNGFRTQFRIFYSTTDFSRCPHLSRGSLLHFGCGGNGVFEKSEDKDLPSWFSRGISGVSTSTMVFKIQALTRRIGFTSAIKQWVFDMEFMDMSTHLEIFHQESHFTSEFAVVPPSVLDIFLPAPFWGRQQVVVHSSEESGLTTSSSYIPSWIISSGFQEDAAPSRMDHPLQSVPQSGFFCLLRI